MMLDDAIAAVRIRRPIADTFAEAFPMTAARADRDGRHAATGPRSPARR